MGVVRSAHRVPRKLVALTSRRLRYAALAIFTVGLGFFVHMHGHSLPGNVRDILGDMLWAMMIFWILACLAPTAPRAWLTAAAIAICVAVELSQLLHNPTLHSARSSMIGHLVLGSDFDARDLFAYSAGVIAAALLDRWMIQRERPRTRTAESAQQ